MTRHAITRTALAALAATVLFLLPAAALAEHTGAGYADGVANGDEYRGPDDDAYLPRYGAPGTPGEPAYGTDDAPAGYDTGYSYVRNLEGSATLLEPGGERQQLERNVPVLAGDRVWVAPRSRVEVLLSDGNLLRVDADSEVTFRALALSPEGDDRATVIELHEGNLQLVVFADALGDELPRVDLPNATFYAGEAGRYRLTSDRGDWSQVVVRGGWAEVVTERDASVLRAGEELLVDGARRPRTLTRQASGYDTLESWGRELDARVARGDRYAELDRSLRYAAAPLDEHGSWISVAGSSAWRPFVDAGWSPYRDGRWQHTRLGLTWVSHEPWGWVPYHYGTWDFVAGYGWVWYPGARFAPAWVYWYWGPSHVAWVPAGYYTRYYGHRFRFGVFGWYGGRWDPFDRWVVCPTTYFGHRHQHRHAHDGRYWHRRYGDHPVPRGIIATDTRPLGRDQWRDPQEAMRVLRTRPGVVERGGRDQRGRAELPDLTPYVARSPELPDEVRRVVRVDDTRRRAGREDGRRGTGGGGGSVADVPRAPAVRARPGTPATGDRGDGARRGSDDGVGRATGSRPTVIRRPGLEGVRTPAGGVSDGADRGERNGAVDTPRDTTRDSGPRRIVRPRVYTAPEDGARPERQERGDAPRARVAPRGSADPAPGVARSPRFRGSDRSPASSAGPTPPPRSQRAGSPEPPARRVIRGARSSAGRSTTSERPSAGSRTRVSTPRSRPSSGARSSSPSSRRSVGGDSPSRSSRRPSAGSRSSSRSRSSAGSRSSGSRGRSSAGSRSSGSRSSSSARSRSSGSRSSGSRSKARSRDKDDG